jgi:hypothetical protein
METEPAFRMLCFLKKFNNGHGQSPKKRRVSQFNITCALFSILFTHNDLAMQALVWLSMVQLRAMWFGASHVNLR